MKIKSGLLCSFFLALTLFLAGFSLFNGAASLSFSQVMTLLFYPEPSASYALVWQIRMARILAAVFAGAGLALSGLLIQDVLSNPLASPGIIGINAGAGIAVVIVLALFPASFSWLSWSAIAGSLAAMGLVLTFLYAKKASRMSVILAGLAVSQVFMAGIEAICTLVPDALAGYADFKMGGFSGITYARMAPGAAIILITALGVCFFHTELSLMQLGSQKAASLGLNSARWRAFFLCAACLLSAGSVSFAGLIGFVGLVVPHICRRLCLQRNGWFMPAAAFAGSSLVLLADLVARTAFKPYEIPGGILLSLLGGLFFLYLLLKERRHGS